MLVQLPALVPFPEESVLLNFLNKHKLMNQPGITPEILETIARTFAKQRFSMINKEPNSIRNNVTSCVASSDEVSMIVQINLTHVLKEWVIQEQRNLSSSNTVCQLSSVKS